MRDMIETHIAEVRRQLKAIEKTLDGYKSIESSVGTAKLLHVLTDIHLKLVRAVKDERYPLGPYKGTPA